MPTLPSDKKKALAELENDLVQIKELKTIKANGTAPIIIVTNNRNSPVNIYLTPDGVMSEIDKIRIPTAQRYSHIYTILSFVSGFVLIVVLLALTIFFPDPTKFQLRVWLTVLALSGGAFATVITGKINLKASIGTQLTVGAAGAIAITVLFYLFNPAVLE